MWRTQYLHPMPIRGKSSKRWDHSLLPFLAFFSPLQGLTVVHPILPVSFPQQPNAQNNGLFVCQTQSASKEKSVWACNWHEGNYKRLAVVLTGILDCVWQTAKLFLTSIGTLHKGTAWWSHWLPNAHFCGQISCSGTISRRKCTTWCPEWLKPRGLLPKWLITKVTGETEVLMKLRMFRWEGFNSKTTEVKTMVGGMIRWIRIHQYRIWWCPDKTW
jgi:hypothetical protein